MKNSLRFNPKPEWNNNNNQNRFFFGLVNLLYDVSRVLRLAKSNTKIENPKMLEIGSYKGESTMIFASSGIFKEIHCIDPYKGNEESNIIFKENWDDVKKEFIFNTRYFDNIILHEDYSYNIVNKLVDKYFDFIYIDGSHEYKDVKKDLELYLPKTTYLIGGHDYQKEWPGVVKAVSEVIKSPIKKYWDESWLTLIK